MYYQCKLRLGDVETKGWIEERGAKVGNHVELIKLDGNFWVVMEVYKPGMSLKALQQKQSNDRNALPSIQGNSNEGNR